MAWRTILTGYGDEVSDADIRDAIETTIRNEAMLISTGAPWPEDPRQREGEMEKRERAVLGVVRDKMPAFGRRARIDALTDDEILVAVRAVNNRGGYDQRAPVKLGDALDAIWTKLAIEATWTDRTRRRRKQAGRKNRRT